MTSTYLSDCVEDVLESAQDAVDVTRTTHTNPERVFVAHGEPVVVKGCEQLTVHLDTPRAVWQRSKPGQPRVPEQCQALLVGRAIVQLWRCWPEPDVSGVPSADAYTAASQGLEVDLWCLLTGLHEDRAAESLVTDHDCKSIVIGDAQALRPLGGMAGWQLAVEFALLRGGPVPAS